MGGRCAGAIAGPAKLSPDDRCWNRKVRTVTQAQVLKIGEYLGHLDHVGRFCPERQGFRQVLRWYQVAQEAGALKVLPYELA